MDLILFYVFGAVMVLASLFVVGQRNPMYSVLLLILSFGALSGLYVVLDAPFVAVTQIIIYAGAIMVLFLFVVMLLNARKEGDEAAANAIDMFGGPGPRRLGAVLSVLLVAELGWALMSIQTTSFDTPAGDITSVREIGRRLFTDYAFAFEATSLLILVAMVGAVILARKQPREKI